MAVVDNLNPMELIDVMSDWGAVNIIQRPAIDKQLVEMVERYASSENIMFILDHTLIPRKSDDFIPPFVLAHVEISRISPNPHKLTFRIVRNKSQ